MLYQCDGIVRDVRVAMDENRGGEQLIVALDTETLSLNDMIRSKIEEGVRLTVSEAPLHLTDGWTAFGDAVEWDGEGRGRMPLPDDFLRLVVFRMSDWERPVSMAIAETDARYPLQFSRCRGLRGTPQKPVVAIVNSTEGRVLEFFSCRSEDATVDAALYLSAPKIDDGGGVDIPERCYRSAVYMIAALSYASLGDTEKSGTMRELSKINLV